MDKKDFESLLNKYPDCVSDGKKLSAFLKDLYPDVPKAIVNTLTIMADDGIIAEIQMSAESSTLVAARLQKKLEDDYGLSQKIISECFSLIAHKRAESTQVTPNLAFNPNDFVIKNGVLEEYKGSSSVVVIPDSVTSIGEYAFYDCSRLTSIVIPNSVTSIGEYAFEDCSGLTSIIILDSVTSIGDFAFCGCSGLTSVAIPDSVTSIGSYAFENCTNLTSVTIGNGVMSIGGSAFYGCTVLTNITVTKGNTKYHSAGNCLIETESKTLIAGCKNSIIPTDGSVTSIGDYAFDYCTGLTSVTIPNSVTSIGDGAFSSCRGLTSVTIGNSVTSIGSNAFYYCTGLTSVTIPDSVESIGREAFHGCNRLTSATIGKGVTSIGISAFWGCTGLTSITIPDSVTIINYSAFRGCTGLTSVTIGNGVTSISNEVFSGCSNLTIYCEAKSKPIGWSSDWNPGHRPVVWGAKKIKRN